jgi:hypothetical protein
MYDFTEKRAQRLHAPQVMLRVVERADDRASRVVRRRRGCSRSRRCAARHEARRDHFGLAEHLLIRRRRVVRAGDSIGEIGQIFQGRCGKMSSAE